MWATGAKEIERSSIYWRVRGSIPASPNQHAKISLGKTINPNLPLMAVLAEHECERKKGLAIEY